MYVGTKAKRVDAFDKVTGRAKFTEDLCPRDALVAKVNEIIAPAIEEGLFDEWMVKHTELASALN